MAETTGTTVVASDPPQPPAPPAPPHANPFKALALLMKSVTDSLENAAVVNAPPRWVRVVRVRDFLKPKAADDETIASGVRTAVNGFTTGMSYIFKYTLIARDLLTQGDAVKALFEVSVDFVDTITKPDFIDSITSVVDGPSVSTSPLSAVSGAMADARKIVDKVPGPEDLDIIGAQMYRMLVIEQLATAPDAKVTAATDSHIDIGKTGKLRLIQWGLGSAFTVHDVVKGTDGAVTAFGTRRVWKDTTANLPAKSVGLWHDATHPEEEVFSFAFADGNALKDVAEAKDLLYKLKYYSADPAGSAAFDDDLATRLRQFQYLNGLKVTGELDNPSINQLMHLGYDPDVTKGSIRRAKPYDADKLKNVDLTKPLP